MSLTPQYLKVSDGTGDAALMHVTADRAISSIILEVDTIVGVPTKFIATSGTLLSTGFIDPDTVTNFYGQINGSDLQIDGFLPGSTDLGNTENQVIVIKPNTFWANLLVDSVTSVMNGLTPMPGTATYVSATSFTLDGNWTLIALAGEVIKLTNGTVKYVTISSTSYSGVTGLTTFVVTGDALAVGAITDVYLSKSFADGWEKILGTVTYASPTTVVVDSAVASKLSKGDKFKIDQSIPLTGYWPLNSNSTSSPGSFTATDTAITYSSGKFSNAATFNGTTSKVVITDTALLKPTGPYTIGFWVKTASTGSFKMIFQSYSRNTNSAGLKIGIGTSGVIFWEVGNNASAGGSSLTTTTNITDNAWHYVVCTYQNGYGKIFVDGLLEASGYQLAPVYAGTNYVRIGAENLTGTDVTFMNGQIDDLFLINGHGVDEAWVVAKYATNAAQGTSDIAVTKKFYATLISGTTVTLNGGSDYAVYNGAITNPAYSKAASPTGFPNYFNWVPTYSASGAMTFTAVVGNLSRFRMVADEIQYQLDASGTLGGTATNAIYFTVPVSARVAYGTFACMVDDVGTSGYVSGCCSMNGINQVQVVKYNASAYGLGTPRVIRVSGSYQIA